MQWIWALSNRSLFHQYVNPWLIGSVSTCLALGLLPAQAQVPTQPAVGLSEYAVILQDLRAIEGNTPTLPGLEEPTPYLPTESQTVTVHLVLRLRERRVYVYRGDAAVVSFQVAIGKPETPTPTGEFEVFQLVENPVWQSPWTGEVHEPGADSALGLRWIGFAHMPNGIIGFHGTPTVSSIGRAASNGCVRLRNEDVLALFEHVEMGTPVIVEP
jgi:lipoprotein-anchoring transpeptidase ErfK/SrfK